MTTTREVNESPIYQGEDENIVYTLLTTPWGSSPSSAATVIKRLPDLYDMSTEKLSGSTSMSGDTITTPTVTGLTAGTRYSLEIRFIISGNTFEAFCEIIGEE